MLGEATLELKKFIIPHLTNPSLKYNITNELNVVKDIRDFLLSPNQL